MSTAASRAESDRAVGASAAVESAERSVDDVQDSAAIPYKAGKSRSASIGLARLVSGFVCSRCVFSLTAIGVAIACRLMIPKPFRWYEVWIALFCGALALTMTDAWTAEQANYDEAAVPRYTLPDVLAGPDGRPARNAEAWRATSRPHQLRLLETAVYGRRLPAVPVRVVGDVERSVLTLVAGAEATRLQARLRLGDAAQAVTTDVLVYLPHSDRPVPVFLHLNFKGNQGEHPDPGIRLCAGWLPHNATTGIIDTRATEASRAKDADGWPVETLLARGYGLATAYYGDVFPDRADGRAASALVSLGRPIGGALPADEPGAIATWAWQLSRILDWLVTRPEVDPAQVIVVGHSRNGKAALWAGACDERFAMVVSNESGCGGAALERRTYGETVEAITRRFPHWFCPEFRTYADREAELPVDAHVTLARTAPRPLFVASAVDDRGADPRGEFLAAVAAEPVWKLFGLEGLGTREWPPADAPVGRTIGYHVRSGEHALMEYDWQRFADVADRTLRGLDSPAGSTPR